MRLNSEKSRAPKPGSQAGRQLARLMNPAGEWVPAYEMRNPDGRGEILQQNARLWELKHVHGYDVENRQEWRDGVCHSSYRVRVKPAQGVLFAGVLQPRHRDDG